MTTEFTALDFLSVLFSLLRQQNISIISSKKLMSVIEKYRDEFINLFINIDINNNCGIVYSYDLEESISMLQILGTIHKSNPKYERIIVKMDKESAIKIIDTCPKEYLIEIQKFIKKFLNERSY